MIRIEEKFNARADELWSIVGIPDRVDWVPGVTACEFDGEVRKLAMPGAGDIAERILLLDNDTRIIEYSCIESAAPLEHHLAKIQIVPTSEGCLMTWTTEVRPEAFEPFIKDSMQGCLVRIAEILAD
ncbi:MAG: SRPBCC family protein [Pseudomonadales bacterium]|nr:SRPBCC family protein [Pseudomonadales bacterium]MBO6564333.1 SRPBCC family protein [Pseudomonadales bacterium]MBO6596391.1 SRPBCC family protein [Pseudomonadales bacterium]MBO6657811.1 SRPBCC family protein [Pseudomonadales bacterium]MBO6822871.1 SRPBCC family protein [Pseudomonadales bacterium]